MVGVFWGVPMVTRELETGTHSLVWNQTVTRKRWLATKLGVGVLAAMVAAGLLSLAVSWWASPIDALASHGSDSPPRCRACAPLVFAARGIAPIGYAAFAFVLGVAVGIVLRRTVAAMAVTLVVFVAVQVAVPFLVRPYLLPATEETVAITDGEHLADCSGNDDTEVWSALTVRQPAGAWVLTNETVDPAGNAVSPLPDLGAGLHAAATGPARAPAAGHAHRSSECFAQLSPTSATSSTWPTSPASRFWPLQWIERRSSSRCPRCWRGSASGGSVTCPDPRFQGESCVLIAVAHRTDRCPRVRRPPPRRTRHSYLTRPDRADSRWASPRCT